MTPPPPTSPFPDPDGTAPRGGGRPPLVDWPAFEDEYDGELAVVERLVSTVIRTRSGDPGKLRAAAASADADTIRFVAHGLKTVGGLIKCRQLADEAKRVEVAARDLSAGAPALALELADTLARMLSELGARFPAAG